MQCLQKQDDHYQQSDIIGRARALVARLPERKVSVSSRRLYAKKFYQMWNEEIFDPLRPGDARDTYQVRRAALHHAGRRLMVNVLETLEEMAAKFELGAYPQYAFERQGVLSSLDDMLCRLEPAIDRDPPQWDGQVDFSRESRWTLESECAKPRGAGSKKYALPDLPRDWIAQFWGYVPTDHKYRDAIAVLSVSPARVGEVVPGDRPSGFSKGVAVLLDDHGCLLLITKPQKTHGGKFGMESSGVKIDPVKEGPYAEYLAQRCKDEGGAFIVTVKSANALSKAIKRMGDKAFPDGPMITPNLFRNQRMADAKAAFGAGEKVALGAGQCIDGTQSYYGNVAHGRKGGFLDAFGSRKPKLVAVERARELGNARKKRLKSDRSR